MRFPTRLRYWLADRLGDLLYLLTPGYRRNVRSNSATCPLRQRIDRADHRGMSTTSSEFQRETGPICWSCRNGAPPSSATKLRLTPGSTENDWMPRLPGERAASLSPLTWAHSTIVGHFLHALGYKFTIVTGRTTARIVFDGVTYLRQSNGLPLVEATASGVRRAIQAVMQGECAVIVTDRDFFQNGTQSRVLWRGDDSSARRHSNRAGYRGIDRPALCEASRRRSRGLDP